MLSVINKNVLKLLFADNKMCVNCCLLTTKYSENNNSENKQQYEKDFNDNDCACADYRS